MALVFGVMRRSMSFGVERQALVDLGQHGHQPGEDQRRVRGHEGVGGHDHFVARLQPHRQGRNHQGAGAGVGGQGVLDAAVLGELLLEGVDLVRELRVVQVAVAEHIARIEHVLDFAAFFLADPISSGPWHGFVSGGL